MACSSGELHAICFLWAHVFYVLILPFFTAFLLQYNFFWVKPLISSHPFFFIKIF